MMLTSHGWRGKGYSSDGPFLPLIGHAARCSFLHHRTIWTLCQENSCFACTFPATHPLELRLMLASRLPKPSPHRVAVAGKRFGPRACRLAAFRSAVVRSILPRPVPKWGCLRPKGTAQIDRDRRARLLTIRASLVMPRLKRRRSPRTKPSHDGSFNPPRTIGSPAGAMERL